MADKLFSSDLRAMERALNEAEVPAQNLVRAFTDLDKHARNLSDSTDELQEQFGEVVDITKKLFAQEKSILQTNIQNVDITKEITKATKQNNHAHAKYLKSIEGEFNKKKLIQKETMKQLDTIGKVQSVASKIPGVGSALSSIIGDFGDSYKEAVDDPKTRPEALGKGLKTAFKGAGLAIAAYIGKNLFESMQGMGAGLMDVLSRPEFIFFGAESRAIADEFGNMNESSLTLGLNMKMMSIFSGVTAENQAKIMGMMAATSDLSLEALHSQMASYKQAGVPFKAIMEDVAGNTEFFAKFSKDGGANIFDAAKRAKELGINLGDVSSISSSLLDFESSIENQMKAQVLLGRNLNLDKARQLAFTGDTVGLQDEILRQVGSEAEFNKMNYLQREALAGAVGLSVERMSALVRQEESAAAAGKKNYVTFAALGALLVGIAGAVIGAITMGVGVKKALSGAWKGGLGGAAVGAGLGVGAAKMGNKVPGLQEGGIVATPMIANIAERGPEAVVPLPRDGMKVDMAQTNLLLERLIRKVGDMGVSA